MSPRLASNNAANRVSADANLTRPTESILLGVPSGFM